jgi:hypothetical protein
MQRLARRGLFTPQHGRRYVVIPAPRHFDDIASWSDIISEPSAKHIHPAAAPDQPRELPLPAWPIRGAAAGYCTAAKPGARPAARRSTGMDGGQIHNVAENCGTPSVRAPRCEVKKTHGIHRPAAALAFISLPLVPVAPVAKNCDQCGCVQCSWTPVVAAGKRASIRTTYQPVETHRGQN